MAISALETGRAYEEVPAPGPERRPSLLGSVLEAACRAEPAGILFRDQPGRVVWSGRQSRDHSRTEASATVRRLAEVLAGLGLPPGARVAVCLPGGTEACLTILAIESAGLLPCILPLDTMPAELEAVVEAVDIRAAVTQARFGDLRPAETWCAIAANYFRLRFLLAFGPDVPDGVLDLDPLLVAEPGRPMPPRPDGPGGETGLVTFGREHDRFRPVYRTCRSLVASAATLFGAVKIRSGERILSLLAGDDLKGLCTGLVAALMSGAVLETHELFDGHLFVEAMDEAVATHIVCPGWAEANLAGTADGAASTILVHDVPLRLGGGGGLSCCVVDVIAFDETALLAIRRTPGGAFTLTVDHLSGCNVPGELLQVALDDAGGIKFRGLAAATGSPARTVDPEMSSPDMWRASGHSAEIFAGILLGIT